MSEPRKFYKTILRQEILSEEPIPDNMTLADIYEETISGRYSGRPRTPLQLTLNGPQMARALRRQGSDPEFFQLNDDGLHQDDAPVLWCKVCGEGLPPNAHLREHLEEHNPNAKQMEDEEVQDCFRDYDTHD